MQTKVCPLFVITFPGFEHFVPFEIFCAEIVWLDPENNITNDISATSLVLMNPFKDVSFTARRLRQLTPSALLHVRECFLLQGLRRRDEKRGGFRG